MKREQMRLYECENEKLFENVGREDWVNEFRSVEKFDLLALIQ